MENKCGKKDSNTCRIDCIDCIHAEKIIMKQYFLDKLNARDKQKIEIETFVKNNGWEFFPENSDEIKSYIKKDNIGIDIDDHEVVLIGEEGDFCHIPINIYCLYTLFGYLFQNRYIAIDYKWI